MPTIDTPRNPDTMPIPFADRLNNVETSAIRELFKLLGKPGIISFAGGFPDSAMFDVAGIKEAANQALTDEPGAALQYGATEGYNPCANSWPPSWPARASRA
jgi:2-aminoadipate transaminase